MINIQGTLQKKKKRNQFLSKQYKINKITAYFLWKSAFFGQYSKLKRITCVVFRKKAECEIPLRSLTLS